MFSDDINCSMNDKDDRGHINYENKFKNRGKDENRCETKHSKYKQTQQFSYMINRDIEQHKTVDYHQPGADLYRKSPIQMIVPYNYDEKNKLNVQNHMSHLKFLHNLLCEELEHKKNQEQKELKINLRTSLIANIDFNNDKRLSIGNYNALNGDWRNKNFDIVIIFVSVRDKRARRFLWGKSKVKKYMVTFADSRFISYREFIKIVNRMLQIIDDNPDANILIVCEKGINRSVSIAMSYGMLRHNYTYDLALAAIENAKNNNSWHNLTNVRMCNILRSLSVRTLLRSTHNTLLTQDIQSNSSDVDL